MASTSSMKMMAGAFSFANLNTSLTMRGPCARAQSDMELWRNPYVLQISPSLPVT